MTKPPAPPPPSAQLRTLQPQDLPALAAFWNRAFAGRRNFRPISADEYRRRILECPAFDAAGLILAWQRNAQGDEELVGLVHALRPPALRGPYRRWSGSHALAVLYVEPRVRKQGIGSRLLQAAENWLYYCPVDVGGQALPCYGGVEGPRSPFFGSPQHMGVAARDTELLHFLSKRGYAVVQPGDVSMTLEWGAAPPVVPEVAPGVLESELRVFSISQDAPFTGQEPPGRAEMARWGDNGGDPYAGLVLADGDNLLRGAIIWLPLHAGRRAGIFSFWLAPELRGRGLGGYLLDRALGEMASGPPPRGGFASVEVATHLTRHAAAARLYAARGFVADEAWVHLVKT